MGMHKQIEKFLRRTPGAKARAIASEIGSNKSDVNSALYGHPELFYSDTEVRWFLVSQRGLRIEFAARSWLTAGDLERDLLAAGSPLEGPQAKVTFVLANGTKVMIDALARLLALSNQLVQSGKEVVLDLSECRSTLTYLDRIAFFKQLHSSVQVLPRRPRGIRAALFGGNNDGVVELLEIDPAAPDQNIPKRLQKSFVRCAGERYASGAFTVLAELFGNVQEHSESTILGFAGLQFYERARHVQAVISDSGVGIVESLRPVLAARHPDLARQLRKPGVHFGVKLLEAVFARGGLSKVADEGRGLGLKRSEQVAQQFSATISVRQDDFELRVFHENGRVRFAHSLGLVRLRGTHICFDLKLDGSSRSP
jgi:hypothetical protein